MRSQFTEPLPTGGFMQSYAINNDTDARDSNGNGCSWYDNNVWNQEYFTQPNQWDNCESFNTPEFSAV